MEGNLAQTAGDRPASRTLSARQIDRWCLILEQTKYKQSKAEANAAQNTLQKEITTLRDTNRTLQLKLRDIEVSNDDFERQARNTTSSLEDLESKYNVSIERGVMAEEEIKAGEQERETLRIETQRLRDELSDLKIEADIRQDKLRRAEGAAERHRRRQPPRIAPDLARPQSALSEISPTTSTSSPTIATPPTKSASSEVSETLTPPSPPVSEKSTPSTITTPALPVAKSRLSMADSNTTPRPSYQKHSSLQPRHSRGPSVSLTNDRTFARRTTLNRADLEQKASGLPHSGSLHQIRGLRTKMTNLEERLKSARSKLPAPTSTPPRVSPRSSSVVGHSFIPATVTLRSNKKRIGGSNASSVHTPTIERPASRLSSAYTPTIDRPSSRLSFGIPQLSPTRDMHSSRPPSRDPHNSRPSSRASLSSRQSISHLPSATPSGNSRPSSRQSNTGSQSSLGHYANSTAQSESRRPRSSIGGSYASTHGHSHSASVNRLSNYGSSFRHREEEEEESGEVLTPTPSRRTTMGKGDGGSSIPGIAPASAKKRYSGLGSGRRISLGPSTGGGEMGPPERRGARKLSGVGETF